MKNTITLFFSAIAILFFTSCGEEAASKPKKKEKDLPLVEIKNGIYTEYYPGRTAVKFQGPQTEDGLRNGRWFFYSEAGTEQSMTEYTMGKKNGLTMVRYPNGNVRYTGEYRDDKEAGLWIFRKEDGTVDFEKNYDEPAK